MLCFFLSNLIQIKQSPYLWNGSVSTSVGFIIDSCGLWLSNHNVGVRFLSLGLHSPSWPPPFLHLRVLLFFSCVLLSYLESAKQTWISVGKIQVRSSCLLVFPTEEYNCGCLSWAPVMAFQVPTELGSGSRNGGDALVAVSQGFYGCDETPWSNTSREERVHWAYTSTSLFDCIWN